MHSHTAFPADARTALDQAETALCQADSHLLDACLALPSGPASGAAVSMGNIIANLKAILRNWPTDRHLVRDAVERIETCLASLKGQLIDSLGDCTCHPVATSAGIVHHADCGKAGMERMNA